MAKPPRIRHSKSRKEAVTIDLGPDEVKRVEDAEGQAPAASEEEVAATVPDESVTTANATEAAAPEAPESTSEATDNSAREKNLFDAQPIPDEEAPSPDADKEREFGRAAAEQPRVTGRRTGGVSAVVGGVIGAAIALAGAGALQWAGVLPISRGADATGPALQVLRGEVDALRQEVNDARASASNPATGDAVGQANKRIDELNAALEQMRSEIQSLGSSIQQDAGAGDREATQALANRVSQLEATVKALPQQSGSTEEVERRIAALEEGQRAATQEAAAEASRLAQIEKSVAELSRQVEEQAAQPGMMLAVAAAALKSAIDRGTPFMTELETYAAVAPDSPDVAALRDLAASGVPTHAQIEAELPAAADRMLAATRPVNPDAGFIDQLWSSARSLVQVRPVGEVEGEGPPAIVARMEVAIREGKYDEALQEYEALPEPAKAAGAEFIEKVRARHTADQLIAKALAGAAKTPGGEG